MGLPWVELDDRPAIYAKLLPEIRDVAWRLGYAIAEHGTARRDFDLVAVPWIDAAAPAEMLVEKISEAVGGNPRSCATKPHGRRAWCIHLQLCVHLYIDLSVMPRLDGATP